MDDLTPWLAWGVGPAKAWYEAVDDGLIEPFEYFVDAARRRGGGSGRSRLGGRAVRVKLDSPGAAKLRAETSAPNAAGRGGET